MRSGGLPVPLSRRRPASLPPDAGGTMVELEALACLLHAESATKSRGSAAAAPVRTHAGRSAGTSACRTDWGAPRRFAGADQMNLGAVAGSRSLLSRVAGESTRREQRPGQIGGAGWVHSRDRSRPPRPPQEAGEQRQAALQAACQLNGRPTGLMPPACASAPANSADGNTLFRWN